MPLHHTQIHFQSWHPMKYYTINALKCQYQVEEIIHTWMQEVHPRPGSGGILVISSTHSNFYFKNEMWLLVFKLNLKRSWHTASLADFLMCVFYPRFNWLCKKNGTLSSLSHGRVWSCWLSLLAHSSRSSLELTFFHSPFKATCCWRAFSLPVNIINSSQPFTCGVVWNVPMKSRSGNLNYT